jgi:acetyl esterase/lipase
MAAAVTLMASERPGPKIDLHVLLYPVVDAHFSPDPT